MESEKYVLEWSRSQNAFHVQTLNEMISRNQTALLTDKFHSDYIILLIGDEETVRKAAKDWSPRLDERDRVRNQERPRLYVPSRGIHAT